MVEYKYRAMDIGKECGLTNISRALDKVPDLYKKKIKTKNKYFSGKPGATKNSYIWFLNEKGRDFLIGKSRKAGFKINFSKEAMIYQLLKQPFPDIESQFQIDPYRCDFYLPKYNVIIEYDEKYHNNQKEADILRQEVIESKGYNVFRIKEGEEYQSLRTLSYWIACLITKSDDYSLNKLVESMVDKNKSPEEIKSTLKTMGE